jgi:hypothetical protein
MSDLTKTEILEKIQEHSDKLKFYEDKLNDIEVDKIIEDLKIIFNKNFNLDEKLFDSYIKLMKETEDYNFYFLHRGYYNLTLDILEYYFGAEESKKIFEASPTIVNDIKSLKTGTRIINY